MRKQRIRITLILVAALTASSALAQDLSNDWWTIDGGGEMFTTGGDFELSGTIGQPDAGEIMTGGDFELAGGFWPGAAEDEQGRPDAHLVALAEPLGPPQADAV